MNNLPASQIVETNSNRELIGVAKNSAYNKNFSGDGQADTVARGDHTHAQLHSHLENNYSPTFSDLVNIDSVNGIDVYFCNYFRVGSMITISMNGGVRTLSEYLVTSFNFSLPLGIDSIGGYFYGIASLRNRYYTELPAQIPGFVGFNDFTKARFYFKSQETGSYEFTLIYRYKTDN